MRYKNVIFFLFCIHLLVSILNGHLFNFLNERFFHLSSENEVVNGYGAVGQFFLMVILAPVIETILYNYYPVKLLEYLKVQKRFLLILLPSILFAASHFYNSLYVVMTFFGGLIMNNFYLMAKARTTYAIYWIMILHALYNLYGYLFVV